jgi:UDP-N-acetylmuramate--alanine ligase
VLGKTRKVHFVGVGGIGMSGIAELLANLGYAVSGSDEKRSAVTDRLASLGIGVTLGHRATAVGDSDVVVVSSAVRAANPEVIGGDATPEPRSSAPRCCELCGWLQHCGWLGRTGSHTTTSMVAFMLERAGLTQHVVCGGPAFWQQRAVRPRQPHGRRSHESDRSFLMLPTIAVVTNIDYEHLENYGGFDDLLQAFVDFANHVPFYGGVVACADDANLAGIIPRLTRRVTTYGLTGQACDVTATDIRLNPHGVEAVITRRGRRADGNQAAAAPLGSLRLQVPGRHNLQNALAAVTVGLELDVPFERIASALQEFRGVERRFDVRGEANGILIVDDYGHHPTEIAAVLEAARGLNRRLIVAFQPHRFTRTAALMDAFGPALVEADHIVLADIYAAGEEPLAGITVDAFASAIRRTVRATVDVAPSLDEVVTTVLRASRPGDMVMTLGAGSISTIPERLIDALNERAGLTTGGVA